ARGRIMAGLADRGAMASIATEASDVEALRNGDPVVIAGLNAPRQTVISGAEDAVMQLVSKAQARGIAATRLPVSHAFHSPIVAPAVPALADALAREEFRPLRRAVISTVAGARLAPGEDLRGLLCHQVTAPVRFLEAVTEAAEGVDLWIEVGPGRVLSGLVSGPGMAPVVAVDAGGPSLVGLLSAVGAAFALGVAVAPDLLFAGRHTRPFPLDWSPRFFSNPCERAPVPEDDPPGDLGQWDRPRSIRSQRILDTGSTSVGPARNEDRWRDDRDYRELVRSLVAERSDLPVSAVEDGHHLLSDLHLNSILVGQLVAESCRRLGLPPPVAPTHYADATVAEVADALMDLERTGGSEPSAERGRLPAGVDGWVRSFTIELVERPRPPQHPPECAGRWQVLAPPGHPLADRLARVFAEEGRGSGITVCLPPEPDEGSVGLLLDAACAALAAGAGTRFVLVQHGGGGSAFARSLHLEEPGIATCVVDVPPDHPEVASWVVAEAGAASGFTEAHYDAAGRRREPVLRLLPIEELPAAPILGPADVLLVTGGGKGIAAESALALARGSGCRLALIGRSRPTLDAELMANLDRFEAAGITFRYLAADVTDVDEVADAVREAERGLGPITAILHGAGANAPQRLASLDAPAFLRTLAPKVRGARNLLAAVDPDRLRLFVTFGSIIARTGLHGEADYATANEWLTRLAGRFAAEHPSCRCLAVEWSVWSGVGMAERLGTVEALARDGIMPIPPGRGIAILRDLVARSLPALSVVVTGRFGSVPTLRSEPREYPFLRFLERPRVDIPGVELVVDVELATDTDPYLDDHVFRGERLFPAVLGLEAMVQVARTLAGDAELPAFEDVRFERPVSVPGDSTTTIRLAALAHGPGRVEVVLRCASTAFQVDHFRATCCFERSAVGTQRSAAGFEVPGDRVPLDPGRDLYGTILFHEGRFRRLLGYRRLGATECVAEVAPGETDDWFGRYLPPALLLGDPAARDAVIHAVQACIPHRTLLPIGVKRLTINSVPAPGLRFVRALERSHQDDTLTYDLEVTDADGLVCERWEGLRLRAIQGTELRGPWAVPLLGPYLERRVRELIPGAEVSIVVQRDGTSGRRPRTRRALEVAVGHPVLIRRRPDGRPEIADDRVVSSAHAGDLTLAVVGRGDIGCDIEPVEPRPEAFWRDLLGPERLGLAHRIAREAKEGLETSSTRVWAVSECLEKAGAMIDSPLILAAHRDGRVVLASGALSIATEVVRVRDVEPPLVVAIAARSDHARL
ncbi:MAG: SDR family NAD(P)-dependent oxidoreductase, partial [Singulisphaera sp.]|nr:SDR family NAD(P)-dependent oxidoreductase [Singulisphaera sp.]